MTNVTQAAETASFQRLIVMMHNRCVHLLIFATRPPEIASTSLPLTEHLAMMETLQLPMTSALAELAPEALPQGARLTQLVQMAMIALMMFVTLLQDYALILR